MSTGDLERFVRRTANRFGIDINRYRPMNSDVGRLASMLASHGVDIVFDVGANVGQFAQSLRHAGYQGGIISFEPLSAAHAQLLRASEGDAGWRVAPRMALGNHEGEIEIYVAGNSVSSSALGMLSSHANAAPTSVYVGTECVHLSTLDLVSSNYLRLDSVPFLKIDTQGYEDKVLNGAKDLLRNAVGLQLELSFVPLYEGQQLFDQLVNRLKASGFSIWGVWPGVHDPASGRMLQVDAAFFRD